MPIRKVRISYALMYLRITRRKRDELTRQIKQHERQDIQLKKELEEMSVRRNVIEKQRRNKELS